MRRWEGEMVGEREEQAEEFAREKGRGVEREGEGKMRVSIGRWVCRSVEEEGESAIESGLGTGGGAREGGEVNSRERGDGDSVRVGMGGEERRSSEARRYAADYFFFIGVARARPHRVK